MKLHYITFIFAFILAILSSCNSEEGIEDESKIFSEKIAGTDNNHAYVDLGLNVKWATCNIGAKSPEEYGDFFAWGETAPKDVYNGVTYKYFRDDNGNYGLTKYCLSGYGLNEGYLGFTDSKFTLDKEDDAACVNWGGSWRMPNMGDFYELCLLKWEWETVNGISGYKITSFNGNSIFLPAAGYNYGGAVNNVNDYGCYWSSDLCTSGLTFRDAEVLEFNDRWHDNSEYYNLFSQISVRFQGNSIRPVHP